MKKSIIYILCFCILLSVAILPCNVEAVNVIKSGNLIIDNAYAQPEDTVIVNISVDNNPGIMAMTLSINYDSSVLKYEKYYPGFLWDYTVVAHPDSNIIRFVNCENYNRRENDKIISLQFTVNKNAKPGFYPISIDYKAGDLCNWSLDQIMPIITSGGVTVNEASEQCRHEKYGEWTTAAKPGCTTKGVNQRECMQCGHIEIAQTAATGHAYSEKWIVDKPATENSPGVISRHCDKCGDKIDILTFTLEDSITQNFANEPGTALKSPEFVKDLIEKQQPDNSNSNASSDNASSQNPPGNSNDDSSDKNNDKSFINKLYNYLFSNNPTGLIGKISDAIPNKKLLKNGFIVIFLVYFKLFSII